MKKEKSQVLSIHWAGHSQILLSSGRVDRDGEEILAAAGWNTWIWKAGWQSISCHGRVVIESTTNAWHVYDLLER